MKYIKDKKVLSAQYLGVIDEFKSDTKYETFENDNWTFFRPKEFSNSLPEYGFKIHLSATIYNYLDILKPFYIYIRKTDVEWKVVSSFRMLERQNIGYNGYSQIGKFITIYPYNTKMFCDLLNDLELIFKSFRSIKIPSDFQYMFSQIVYYRYGEIQKVGEGSSFVDKRNGEIPKEVHVPVEDYYIKRLNELPKHIWVIDLVKHSGKNLVYKAFDANIKRIVYLKAALYLSNIDIYGTDSMNRLTIEKRALKKLENIYFVPKLLDEFYVNDCYFIELSSINGQSILNLFIENPMTPINERISIVYKIIDRMQELLEYGIVYVDISMSNILIDDLGDIHIIDFEYCKILNEWNPPDIVAGCIGFYDPKYTAVDDKRTIFAIAALLLYMENFCDFKRIIDDNYEERLYDLLKIEFYRNSLFYNVYEKAFSHTISSLVDLKLMIQASIDNAK